MLIIFPGFELTHARFVRICVLVKFKSLHVKHQVLVASQEAEGVRPVSTHS